MCQGIVNSGAVGQEGRAEGNRRLRFPRAHSGQPPAPPYSFGFLLSFPTVWRREEKPSCSCLATGEGILGVNPKLGKCEWADVCECERERE